MPIPMRRLTTILLALAAASGCSRRVQPPILTLPPARPAVADTLDARMARWLDSLAVPGAAVAVVVGGQVAWANGYGLADMEAKEPMRASTVFQVASISKSVAAWGVMKLVERGALSLDSSVTGYLHRWKLPPGDSGRVYNDSVTVRRLLSHTAGLSLSGYPGFDPDSGPLPTVEASLGGATNGVGDVHVLFRPGTKWQYSGGGYTLLQLLVEERTKDAFAGYMKREVLLPLGMNSSSYEWEPWIRPRVAAAYTRVGGRRLPNYLFTAKAAAGLYTTAEDLARFVAASVDGPVGQPAGRRVLRAATVAQMETPAPHTATSNFVGYGFGYIVDTLANGMRYVSHTGGNRGWRSVFVAVPGTGDGIVVLTNSDSGAALYAKVVCTWMRVAEKSSRRGCGAGD